MIYLYICSGFCGVNRDFQDIVDKKIKHSLLFAFS